MLTTTQLRIAPLLFVGVLASANCFSPKITEGVTCGEAESCPAGMQCDPLDQRCRFELLPQGNDLQVIPPDYDFGTVLYGSPISTSTFTILNLGLVPTDPLRVVLQGGSGQFRITDASECQGVSLPVQGSCSITGEFEPTEAGLHTSAITVSDTLSAAATEVSGTGLEPGDLKSDPAEFDFGTHPVGYRSPVETFTLTNTGISGTGNLEVLLVDDETFEVEDVDCDQQVLASLGSCTIQASFTPKTAGDAQASIVASATPGGGISAALIGKVTADISILSEPAPNFGVGSVTSNPSGLNCQGDCTHTFDVPTVTLTPEGRTGAAFKMWSNDNGECGSNKVCTLAMDAAVKTLTATWGDCKAMEFLRCDDSKTLVSCSSTPPEERIITCQHACSIEAGECTECTPGDTICDDNVAGGILICNNEGVYVPGTCPSNDVCMNDACVDLTMMTF